MNLNNTYLMNTSRACSCITFSRVHLLHALHHFSRECISCMPCITFSRVHQLHALHHFSRECISCMPCITSLVSASPACSASLVDKSFTLSVMVKSFTLAVTMGFVCLTAGQLQTRALAMFFTLSDYRGIFALVLW